MRSIWCSDYHFWLSFLPCKSASSHPTVSTHIKSKLEVEIPNAFNSSLASDLRSYFAHLTVTLSLPLPDDTGLLVHLLMVALFPVPSMKWRSLQTIFLFSISCLHTQLVSFESFTNGVFQKCSLIDIDIVF